MPQNIQEQLKVFNLTQIKAWKRPTTVQKLNNGLPKCLNLFLLNLRCQFHQHFHTKVSQSFLLLGFRFELHLEKNIGANAPIKCWLIWPQASIVENHSSVSQLAEWSNKRKILRECYCERNVNNIPSASVLSKLL